MSKNHWQLAEISPDRDSTSTLVAGTFKGRYIPHLFVKEFETLMSICEVFSMPAPVSPISVM
jgi:hypothetical protein